MTLPDKAEMAKVCNRLSSRAEVLGAANAVRRVGTGPEGANFDGGGVVHTLTNGGDRIESVTIQIVGAGPAATSITAHRLEAGTARMTFSDLSEANAQRTLALLGTAYGDSSLRPQRTRRQVPT